MRAVGIILAGGNNNKMRELTQRRAVAAMPIAGSYRAIDFALSNMSNSHIQKVAVLTQYNARSLNEHLNSSKWWDFGRKQGGLYVFTPTITADNGYWYRGTADAIYQNLEFLKRCHEPYVIITSGDAVYKMDYNKVLEYHIAKKADITVVCRDLDQGEDATRFGILKMNENMRIEEFEVFSFPDGFYFQFWKAACGSVLFLFPSRKRKYWLCRICGSSSLSHQQNLWLPEQCRLLWHLPHE